MPTTPSTPAEFALAFVNKLIPSAFAEAESWIAPDCRYHFQDRTLEGPSVLEAFKASHARAERELDQIDYLPGEILEFLPDGTLIGVTDRISLNGHTHFYRDRLLIRLTTHDGKLKVHEIKHLPISSERERLRIFLEGAGPRRPVAESHQS